MQVTWGATRTVILTKRLAIKIPRIYGSERRFEWLLFKWGFKANRQERQASKWQLSILCPVFLSDPLGLFVVMPRCASATPLDPSRGLGSRALCPVEYSYWATKAPIDNHAFNYGYLNRRLVSFDYGTAQIQT